MPTIQKPKDRELVILNVTDTHITKKDLDEKNDSFRTMCSTTEELVRRVKPDLITHTGDFTFENCMSSTRIFLISSGFHMLLSGETTIMRRT